MKTIRDAKAGDKVRVVKLHGEGAVRRRIMDMGITRNTEIYIRKLRRIMDMGITRNTEIYIRKFAPLGDPIEITVRGYELSLRKADAEMIEIE